MSKQSISTEIKVGILVLIGVVLLFYMSFRVERFGFFGERGYELNVVFDNAGGLDRKTPVYIAGVQVGNINDIKLEGYKAKLKLLIREGVTVPTDSRIAIKSQGLLGDKYLEVIPGANPKFLARGDDIRDVITSPDFDRLFERIDTAAKNFGDTMGEFKGLIGEKEKASIKKSIDNIETASTDFKEILKTNKKDVNRIVSKAAVISDKLETVMTDVEEGKGTLGLLVKDDTLYHDARDAVASLKTISADIEQGKGSLGKLAKDDALYVEAKEAVTNIKEITDGIKKGEGTLGKLVKDENLYHETEKALKKVQKGAEGLQEMTPVTVLGTVFGLFF